MNWMAYVTDGTDKHNHLTDGRAKGATIYPPELFRAISRGVSRQMILDAINTSKSETYIS